MLRTVVKEREARVGPLLLKSLELEKQEFSTGKWCDSENLPKSRIKYKNGWNGE